eukprot:1147546-Pelagomonas_calceolata.AAC.3
MNFSFSCEEANSPEGTSATAVITKWLKLSRCRSLLPASCWLYKKEGVERLSRATLQGPNGHDPQGEDAGMDAFAAARRRAELRMASRHTRVDYFPLQTSFRSRSIVNERSSCGKDILE